MRKTMRMQSCLPVLALLLFDPLPLPVQAVMDPFEAPKDESCDVVNPVQQLIFFGKCRLACHGCESDCADDDQLQGSTPCFYRVSSVDSSVPDWG